jgi:hypothetical protein
MPQGWLSGRPWALTVLASLALHGSILAGAWRIDGLLSGYTLPMPEILIADVLVESAEPPAPTTTAVRTPPARPVRTVRTPPALDSVVEPPAPARASAAPPPAEDVALVTPEPSPPPTPPATATEPPVVVPAAVPAPPPPIEDGAAPSPVSSAVGETATASVAPVVEPPPVSSPPISPADFVRLREVTEAAAIASRAEGEPFVGRRDVFEFLLDHLEFATHVTRALRVARYRVWETAEGLFLDDGWGALLRFSVVKAASGTRIIYARGAYRQKILPDIHGEAVVMIEYDFRPAPDGRDVVSAAVTNYVKFDSRLMSALARVASATVTRKADIEAKRLVRVFARISRAVDADPAAVFAALEGRPDVPRRELEAFRRLVFAR